MIKQREKTLKVYISFGDLESAGQWMKYEIKVLYYKNEIDNSKRNCTSFGNYRHQSSTKLLKY